MFSKYNNFLHLNTPTWLGRPSSFFEVVSHPIDFQFLCNNLFNLLSSFKNSACLKQQ